LKLLELSFGSKGSNLTACGNGKYVRVEVGGQDTKVMKEMTAGEMGEPVTCHRERCRKREEFAVISKAAKYKRGELRSGRKRDFGRRLSDEDE
jgi:hypothetical protein